MAEQYAEREVKFDVDADFAVPQLDDLTAADAAVRTATLHLDSTYYDTAGCDLLKSSVTLRRRSGGDDDTGWQLKLPAGTARTELRLPVQTAIPQEFGDLTVGLRRGRPLRRVARIRTERTAHRIVDRAGKVLVEIADDAVRATRFEDRAADCDWREVEAELGSGDDGLLDTVAARLAADGARPAASSSKLARALGLPTEYPGASRRKSVGALITNYLAQQRTALLEGDLATRRGLDDIHDTRVAVRRFRSTLRIFGDVFDPDAVPALDAELAWYGRLLGGVRDPDVLLHHLTAVLAGLPEQLVLGSVAAQIDEHLVGERERQRAALRRAIDGKRYLAMLDSLDRWVDAPQFTADAERPEKDVSRWVRRAEKKFAKRLRTALSDEDAAELHRARKAAKRARYATELAKPALPAKAAKKRIKELKKVQDILGAHQDGIVAAETLLQLARQAGSGTGANAFTYGLLYAHEQDRAASARAEAHELFG